VRRFAPVVLLITSGLIVLGCDRVNPNTAAPAARPTVPVARPPEPADPVREAPLEDQAPPPTATRRGPTLRPRESFALDAARALKPDYPGRAIEWHSPDWREVIVALGTTEDNLDLRVRLRWDDVWGYRYVGEERGF